MNEKENIFWHWPDHVIGKRESRQLRNDHNDLGHKYVKALERIEELESNDIVICSWGNENDRSSRT